MFKTRLKFTLILIHRKSLQRQVFSLEITIFFFSVTFQKTLLPQPKTKKNWDVVCLQFWQQPIRRRVTIVQVSLANQNPSFIEYVDSDWLILKCKQITLSFDFCMAERNRKVINVQIFVNSNVKWDYWAEWFGQFALLKYRPSKMEYFGMKWQILKVKSSHM